MPVTDGHPPQYASDSWIPPRRSAAETFLGFQPPAIGEEEIAAVTETLRSGWLHDRPRRGGARAPLRRVPRREARARGHLRHGRDAPRARRARRRARRRGGHDPDHVAGDRERHRSRGRHAGVRRRPRRRPQHRPRARGLARGPADEGDPASAPRGPAGRPRPPWALGIPVVEDAAHAVERAPTGTKDRRSLRGDLLSLYATKNVAAGEGGIIGTNRDDVADAVDDLRVMRRGHGSRYDIPVPGYKANLSDVLASIAPASSTRSSATGRSASAMSPPTTRALAELDGIDLLGRDQRDTARSTSTSSASTRSGPGRRDEYQQAPRRADRDEHPLPARAPADRVPRALSRADATPGRREGGGRGALAAPVGGALGRGHRGRDRRSAARASPASRGRAARRTASTTFPDGSRAIGPLALGGRVLRALEPIDDTVALARVRQDDRRVPERGRPCRRRRRARALPRVRAEVVVVPGSPRGTPPALRAAP